MIYVFVGAAAAIVGGVVYLVRRKRSAGQPEEIQTAAATSPAEPAATASDINPLPVTPELPSQLPERDKGRLMNAVWYQCENPQCRYSKFLNVHHIIPEIEGGTNRMDNLIVLCSQCRTAARAHKITEEQMQSWITDRSERLQYELDWPYK